jgi:hypothetical protein
MKTRTVAYVGTFPNTVEGNTAFKIVSKNILNDKNLLSKYVHSSVKIDTCNRKFKAIRMYRNGIRRPRSNTTLKDGAKSFDGYIRYESFGR